MLKAIHITLAIIAIVITAFLLGPRAETPRLDASPISLDVSIDSIEELIAQKESSHPTLKPDNEAGIIWAGDSVHQSEYALVFIHGFSATKTEGRPVTTDIARQFNMNLFEARLFGHGLDTHDIFIDLTPKNLLKSALQAVAIGKVIGKKVIIASSSTGGTLALYIAAHDPDIAALICYSPNVEIYDPTAKVVTGPWGLQIARLVTGDDFRSYPADDQFKRYWQTRYRIEGVVAVQSLVEATMTSETFASITQPVFVGCFYRNDEEQDKVVSVAAMRHMMPLIATSDSLKQFSDFPNAGAHVLTSPYRSNDVEGVTNATLRFLTEVVGLPIP